MPPQNINIMVQNCEAVIRNQDLHLLVANIATKLCSNAANTANIGNIATKLYSNTANTANIANIGI